MFSQGISNLYFPNSQLSQLHAMTSSTVDDERVIQFHEMGLDDRIVMAITKLNWREPTLIQEKVIPLALQGKDILARARTGTGKTACVLIPAIQKLLDIKTSASEQKTLALFLAPSKELCNQAHVHLKELTTSCSQEVVGLNIAMHDTTDVQKMSLKDKPDVVFSTPSRALYHLKEGNLDLADVTMVIIDEADLLFSFGYEKSMKAVKTYFPKIYQAFLMSATLDENVLHLKRLVLHNAVTLKLEESSLPDPKQLTQYYALLEDKDKYLLLFTLIKLKLLQGKCLIFVKNIDRCYKVKLFLNHLDIRACVLNTELPANSRMHILQQFNDDHYSIIIASDQSGLSNKQCKAEGGSADKSESSAEYSVSRGIDFQSVSNVINFDFPSNTDAYIHRVGRTARGNAKGTALSLVSLKEMEDYNKVKSEICAQYGPGEEVFKPFNFQMSEVEGFRYRTSEALLGTGKLSVWTARKEQIKREMMNSEKLQAYFAEHPREKQVLHDRACKSTKRLPQSLKYIPEYIIPEKLKDRQDTINFDVVRRERAKKRKEEKREKTKDERKKQEAVDPLDSFSLDAESSTEKFKKKRRHK